MADLNIVNVSNIKGRTVGANVTNVTSDVLVNTFGQSKTFKLNNISITSRENSNTITANVNFVDYSNSNTSYPLIFNFDIPIKSSIEVLSKPVYLEEGDKITVNMGQATNNAVIIISYEELA